jgi:hypothetical protein
VNSIQFKYDTVREGGYTWGGMTWQPASTPFTHGFEGAYCCTWVIWVGVEGGSEVQQMTVAYVAMVCFEMRCEVMSVVVLVEHTRMCRGFSCFHYSRARG